MEESTKQLAAGSSQMRRVTLGHLALMCFVYAVVAYFNVRFMFPVAGWLTQLSPRLQLFGSFLPHLIALLVCVCFVLFSVGKLRLGDVGIRAENFKTGVFATLGFWLITQSWCLLAVVRSDGDVTASTDMIGFTGQFLNLLVTQLIGNAFVEEIVFRGYFLRQLNEKFRGANPSERANRAVATVLAIAVSCLLFALIHIPVRLDSGVTGDKLVQSLVRVAMWGMLFSLLYLTTRNLWFVIGVHGLTNRPCDLFESQLSSRYVQLQLCALIIFLVASWRIFAVRNKKVNQPTG